MFDTCNRKLFQCKRCYSACFLCASKPANFFSLWLITLLSEKTTLVSSCVREERGPPAKVRSVELVLSSFLIRSFNVLFFRLLTEILHHLPVGLTFWAKTFFKWLVLLLKAPCSFTNDEIQNVKDIFIFHARCINAENYFHVILLLSKYILLPYFMVFWYIGLTPKIVRDV